MKLQIRCQTIVGSNEFQRPIIRLYGELGAHGKRDALRRAQIETMRTYPHPFFWTAFYLTGGA